MGVDQSGHAWCKISFDAFNPFDSGLVPIIGGGGGGYMGAVQAMNDTDSEIRQNVDELYEFVTNTSESRVLNAKHYAFYKGKLVLRTNMKRSGSFGIIFLSINENKYDTAADVLRHEYGHTIQLEYLGPARYFFCIGIPSFFEWGDSLYYDRPQEITASIFGGANLGNQTDTQILEGFQYLQDSYHYGIFAWAMYDWGK